VRGDVSIHAVAARDLTRAKAFAEKYSEPRQEIEAFDSYQAIIDHPEIDLVYNPLPINLHAEWTIKALEAGKHVLCEKPFAMNIVEAEAMLEKPFAMNIVEAEAMLSAAKNSGKRVIEALHYRYHEAFDYLMFYIEEEKDLGKIKSIKATFNIDIPNADGKEIRHLPETGGGAFMDHGCYPLSWALMVMGEEPKKVEASAKLTKLGVDESMQAKLTFKNGAVAELSSSMAPGIPFEASLIVEAKNGRAEFINPLAPQMGAKLTINSGRHVDKHSIDPTTSYWYQMSDVIYSLKEGSPRLETEGEAILRQQRTLDRIYEAAGLRHLRYR